MTERFTMFGSTIKDNGEEITAWDCCSLLNEQHETIQQQKEAIEHLSYDSEYLKNNFEDKCKENEELKETLGAILLEVKQDISIRNQTGEIKVFINPNRFELISEVLKKYGALKEWYNE